MFFSKPFKKLQDIHNLIFPRRIRHYFIILCMAYNQTNPVLINLSHLCLQKRINHLTTIRKVIQALTKELKKMVLLNKKIIQALANINLPLLSFIKWINLQIPKISTLTIIQNNFYITTPKRLHLRIVKIQEQLEEE